jgi:threonine aldolase
LLSEFVETTGVTVDSYSRGGTVELLEQSMARWLGKEAALFVPTGTLANHLAIRRHCGTSRQALVPAESHIFNDCGDCVAQLSGIQLVPLAPDRPGPTATEVKAALDRTATGRVHSPVGAVVLESPVRRQMGRIISFEELGAISDLCRANGIPVHLDGARLFMMAAATGVPVQRYCGLFDSVYVSLCKYLGAPFGAILAGSQDFVDDLFHERRMFGGGLPTAWIAAALTLQGMRDFETRLAAAFSHGARLFGDLNGLNGLRITPLPDGSNIVPLYLEPGLSHRTLADALLRRRIVLAAEQGPDGAIPLTLNTTILRRSTGDLLEAFSEAVASQK